jgi:flagellar assembly protein FliH
MSSRARLLAERDASAAGSWYGHADPLDGAAAVVIEEPSAEDKARAEAARDAQAAREVAESAARLVRRLEAALHEVAAFRAELMDRSRPQLIELALAISRVVLHRMVERDPAVVADMAHAALERLNNATDLRVRLNPRDFEALREDADPSRVVAGFIADPRVEPGGCRVESSFGEIDAGINAQLAEISRALLESDEIPQALP